MLFFLSYLKPYLSEVLRAKEDGYLVNGYFVWSLIDNIEWVEREKQRFGLIYNDFKSQERIIKSSGYWFKDFLSK